MRVLLDTSTFLWMDVDEDKLSQTAYQALANEANSLYLSYISIWEIQIKYQLGKLNLRVSLEQLVKDQTSRNNIRLLPLKEAHIYGLSNLPYHHRDPFDRLIISQAIKENLTLITSDQRMQDYDVTTLW